VRTVSVEASGEAGAQGVVDGQHAFHNRLIASFDTRGYCIILYFISVMGYHFPNAVP